MGRVTESLVDARQRSGTRREKSKRRVAPREEAERGIFHVSPAIFTSCVRPYNSRDL